MERAYPVRNVCRPLSVGVVILAAGSSQRMGTPKMLLPWEGNSILGHIIQQWQALGAQQIIVVLAPGAESLGNELDRLHFPAENRIPNPAPKRGMFSSIQCAANWGGWISSLTHWAVVLGDQPHLQRATCRQLLEFANKHPDRVCQPICGSQWRHPVVLPKSVFEQLRSSAAETLREFLSDCKRVGFKSEDPGLNQDIDTPEDYQKALALVRAVPSSNLLG